MNLMKIPLLKLLVVLQVKIKIFLYILINGEKMINMQYSKHLNDIKKIKHDLDQEMLTKKKKINLLSEVSYYKNLNKLKLKLMKTILKNKNYNK